MPKPRGLIRRLRHARPAAAFVAQVIYGLVRILGALPTRWILRMGDAVGYVIWIVDRRGRRVAAENMRVAFGEGFDPSHRRRILQAYFRQTGRSYALLGHLHPLTADRYRRFVDVPADLRSRPANASFFSRGGILVSGHVGNWELLLGLRILFEDLPPTVFMAEEIPYPVVDRVVRKLRGHGSLTAAMRRGGVRAAIRAVEARGCAAMLVDRNVRKVYGGVYAPFLGLEARTTPLPAWLALRHDVPIHPIFCLPHGPDRYRIWVGPDLTQDIGDVPEDRRAKELLTRINAVLERVIRAQPELWNWTLKRFKCRPQPELGPYPTYSIHEPDPEGSSSP